jgi:CDP-diglyceride synthetase
MKSLVDFLLGIVGVVALCYAIWQFYLFAAPTDPQGSTPHLWRAIAGFVVLCVCALAVFLRHSGAEEEIHITQ